MEPLRQTGFSQEPGDSSETTQKDHEEKEEEEEAPEAVTAAWDGTNIALCIFGIMTALIAITVGLRIVLSSGTIFTSVSSA